MNNEKYESLSRRASGIISKWSLDIDPGDLISEAFLLVGDINEDEFCKEMYRIAGNQLRINKYSKDENKSHEDRRCRRCVEVKQSGWFRTWYLRGYLIFDSYCKPCKNIIINELKKRKKHEQQSNGK